MSENVSTINAPQKQQPQNTKHQHQMGYTDTLNQEQTQTKQAHNFHFYVFQSRLREMVEYDDLAELQARELPSLKIADSTKFSQGLIPAIPKVNNGKKNK